MAASERSLRITDSYRQRLITLRDRIRILTVRGWTDTVTLDDLERSHARWLRQTSAMVEHAQRSAVQLTGAYLAAYVASEQNRPPRVTGVLDPARFVGTEDGRPMSALLDGTLVAVLAAIKKGRTDRALRIGEVRAARDVSTAMFTAPRHALTAALEQDEQVAGWRRVPRPGACLACLAAAGDTLKPGEPLRFHDECSCTAEPVVRDVPDTFARPTGLEMFNALPPADQDSLYGAKAALLREGHAQITDFMGRSSMVTVPDRLTEAPLHAVMQ